MATHSSILAWKIPWTKESGRLQSMGSQRIGHNWVTLLFQVRTQFHTFACKCPFSKHQLLKTIFSPLWIFITLIKDQLTIYAPIKFWAVLCSLVYMSVFMLVPHILMTADILSILLSVKCDVSSFVLSQDCFGYLRSFVVSYETVGKKRSNWTLFSPLSPITFMVLPFLLMYLYVGRSLSYIMSPHMFGTIF